MSRLRIQQRTRIYFGCEGQSEQSYAARLSQIADAAGLHLYFDNDLLQPGAGDPLALVEMALKRIAEKERKRGAFAHRAILLDSDKAGIQADRDARIGPLVARHNLALIWQSPCHEAFLLRHFEEHAMNRPATSELAHQALRRVWPEYSKAMPAVHLAARIDLDAIRRVSSVEQQFARFLDQIGLSDH